MGTENLPLEGSKHNFIVWGSVEDVTSAIRTAFLAHQGDLEEIRKAAS